MRAKKILIIMFATLLLCSTAYAISNTYGTYFHVVWHQFTPEENTYYSWLNVLDSTASANLGDNPTINLTYELGEHTICVVEYITTYVGTHNLTFSIASGLKREDQNGNGNAIDYKLEIANESGTVLASVEKNKPASISINVASANATATYHYLLKVNLTTAIINQMSSGNTYYSDITVEVVAP